MIDDLELQPCEIICSDGTIKTVMAKKVVIKAEDCPMDEYDGSLCIEFKNGYTNHVIDKLNEIGCTSFNFESMSDADKNAILEMLIKED